MHALYCNIRALVRRLYLIFRDRHDGFGGSARDLERACWNAKLIVFMCDKRISRCGWADYPQAAARVDGS